MSHQMQSEIAQINGVLDSLDDPRECYALVRERIRNYRLAGAEIPPDLVQLERRLARECIAASQGR